MPSACGRSGAGPGSSRAGAGAGRRGAGGRGGRAGAGAGAKVAASAREGRSIGAGYVEQALGGLERACSAPGPPWKLGVLPGVSLGAPSAAGGLLLHQDSGSSRLNSMGEIRTRIPNAWSNGDPRTPCTPMHLRPGIWHPNSTCTSTAGSVLQHFGGCLRSLFSSRPSLGAGGGHP